MLQRIHRFYQRATFSWISPYIRAARKGQLTSVRRHLFPPQSPDFEPSVLTERLGHLYFRVYKGASLLKALWAFLLPYYVVQIVTELASDLLQVQIAEWQDAYAGLYNAVVTSKDVPITTTLRLAPYALRYQLAQFGPMLVEAFSYLRLFECGIKLRLALVGTVIQQAFSAKRPLSLAMAKSGRLTNLVSIDAPTLQDAACYATLLVAMPFKIVLYFDSISKTLKSSLESSSDAVADKFSKTLEGSSDLAVVKWALLTLGVHAIVQVVLGRVLTYLQAKIVECSDVRVQLTQELVHGIKCVKQLGLQRAAIQRIAAVRTRELRFVRAALIVQTVSDVLSQNIVTLSLSSSLLACIVKGEECTSKMVQRLLTVIKLVKARLFQYIPRLIDLMPRSVPAFKRFSQFLQATSATTPSESAPQDDSFGTGIYADRAQFALFASNQHSLSPKLQRLLNLPTTTEAFSGEKLTFPLSLSVTVKLDGPTIVLVAGPNGAGKTSLVEGLAGNLTLQRGTLTVKAAKIAYCPQTAWILDATVKENIVMGRPYSDSLYQQVLRQCHLLEDIAGFGSQGDSKPCGPQGSMLSGGQRQRVALARLAYGRPQVAILDDSLSALDARVRRSILADLILAKDGLLNRSIIVAAMASRQFLSPYADCIITLGKDRQITSSANVEPLRQLPPSQLPKSNIAGTEETPLLPEKLTVEKYGLLRIFARYLALAGGAITAVVIVALLVAQQFVGLRMDSAKEAISGQGRSTSLAYQYGLLLSLVLSSQFAVGFTAILAHTVAIRKLHIQAVQATAKADYGHLQQSSPRRLFGFFARDQRVVDLELTSALVTMCIFVGSFVLSVVKCASSAPQLLPIMAGMFVLAGVLQALYTGAWRKARELMSLQNASVVAALSESVEGLSSVGDDPSMRQCLMAKLTEELRDLGVANHFLQLIRRWMTLRFEILRILSCTVVELACLVLRLDKDQRPTTVERIFENALNFEVFAKCFAEFDESMISCSLINDLTKQPAEDDSVQSDEASAAVDSDASIIAFDKVDMSYGDKRILSKLSLKIRRGEKIAIVGRTGAGKSSLLSALYRLNPVQGGSIRVDGKSSRSLPLEQLRRRMPLVPQEPTLFFGSIRFNLQPQSDDQSLSDDKLWAVLRSVGLADVVSGLPSKLDTLLADSQLSEGQQQLLCLARALIQLQSCQTASSASGILCLDEATSNGDEESTKRLVDCVLALPDTTVLAVMHNLQGIDAFDRIVVMDSGSVVEDGSFLELSQCPDGLFRSILAFYQNSNR